jgi:hypothetical protein
MTTFIEMQIPIAKLTRKDIMIVNSKNMTIMASRFSSTLMFMMAFCQAKWTSTMGRKKGKY